MPQPAPHNPFEAPQQNSRPLTPPVPTAPCPGCGGTSVDAPSFTWWGGAFGPKIFSHVVCRNYRTGFNRKTGKSNATAIAIYVWISGIVGLGVALSFLLT